MTRAEANNKAKELSNKLSTEDIKNWLTKTKDDCRDEICTVTEWMLDALMVRLSEAEFVAFCGTL